MSLIAIVIIGCQSPKSINPRELLRYQLVHILSYIRCTHMQIALMIILYLDCVNGILRHTIHYVDEGQLFSKQNRAQGRLLKYSPNAITTNV